MVQKNKKPAFPHRKRATLSSRQRRLIFYCSCGLVAVLLTVLVISLIISSCSHKKQEIIQIGPALPADTDRVAVIVKAYDYTSPVPESSAVGESYFSECLFIGDSRMSGFGIYGMLNEADFLVNDNINVGNTNSCTFTLNGETVTLAEALTAKQYKSIYLMFGLNELGWEYPDIFRSSYDELMSQISSLQPSACVYVHKIIPVSHGISESSDYFTNDRVMVYNGIVAELVASHKFYMLDLSGILTENGALSDSYNAGNGIGLNKSGYEQWLSYLKTHTVDKELYL